MSCSRVANARPSQQWRFVAIGGGYFEVIVRHSGKCLNVGYVSLLNGATVLQGTCWGGLNQQWSLVPVGSDGQFQMVARHSGKCLDVARASTLWYAPVVQSACVGGTNQQWTFEPVT